MKQRLKLCMVYMTCIVLLLTGLFSPVGHTITAYAEETEETGAEYPYTLQEFFAYMQHGYQEYNIFCENSKRPATLFATDDAAYEYRAIDTDAKNVTGEIAVICNQEDAEGAEEIETDDSDTDEEESESPEEPAMAEYAPIAYEIEKDESAYIEKIYSGSKLPEELTLTCIQADELTLSDLANYDLYIFEESVRDIGISEEIFLQLDKMLKKDKETFVYGGGMIWDAFGTGEPDGSAVTVIENSGVGEHTVLVSDYNSGGFLVGMSTQGNGFVNAGTPKQKDIAQEEYIKKGYGYKWTSYLLYEQRLSYGILLYEPYTTIKVLPTYKDEVINRDIFKNLNGKTPHSYFRYISQVVLPSSVKTIPDNTFYNYDVLEKINLDYVTTIGNNAFNGCKLLKDVQFSKNQDVTIKESAFENCGLESVTIPGSVKKIGKNAFANNFIIDPRSLEHYATTYEKYTEYQTYIKEHTADEEKDPSIKSVHLTVTDSGLDLEENAFAVEDTCQVSITHQPENGTSTFEFTNQNKEKWEGNGISAAKLNTLTHIDYLRSETKTDSGETSEEPEKGEAGKEESNTKNENIHNVTLIDTKYSNLNNKTIQVENGKPWSNYLPYYDVWSLTDIDLQYTFIGWVDQNGQMIDKNDLVNLQDDITLYTRFSVSGSATEKVYKLHFCTSNKTIDVKLGTRLCDYDIPSQNRENDIFLGWSQIYPVRFVNNILCHERIITPDFFGNELKTTLYPVFQSDLIDKKTIDTTETLSGEPIYRLNDNNTGMISRYDNGNEGDYYYLDQSSFNESDKQNAEIIKNKIVNSTNEKIAVLPKGYTIDTEKLKKKGYLVIKTNLYLDDYISALTYMNCRYFQYLKIIQTPHSDKESDLTNLRKDKTFYHYGNLSVSDFEIQNDYPSFSDGFAYFIKSDIFKEYYNICADMENKLYNIANRIGLHKGMKITDAIWTINDLVIKEYAYDDPLEIYDLYWMLRETDENRNTGKKVDYHGVCASYSKLPFALLGLYGYETIPCTSAVEENGICHSFNKIILNGKVYYCDFCWTSLNENRYMFMTEDNMIFIYHRGHTPDDMGKVATYNRKSTKLSSTKIKTAKNQKGKKMLVTFNKVKNVSGYEIQYGTSSNFKSAKKKTTSKTKISITKLKKNKTYYVRVRPYKTIKLYCEQDEKKETIKIYGSWSKYKKVRIKK